MAHSWKSACVALIATALLAGCGGGGGGGTDDGGTDTAGTDDGGSDDGGATQRNADFSGFYSVASFAASDDPVWLGTYGTYQADGQGAFSGSNTTVNDSVHTGPIAAAGTYSVSSTGAMTMNTSLTGGLSADGNVAIVSRTSAGGTPEICLLMRRSGSAYSDAMFSGSYHGGWISHGMARGPQSSWTSAFEGGPHVADGMGQITYAAQSSNQDGVVGPRAGGNAPYSVGVTGDFTVRTLRGDAQGAILSDGSFAMAGGGTEATGEATPQLTAFIEEGSGMSSASLSGEYWVVGIAMQPNGLPATDSPWSSFSGTATSDGAGTINYSVTQNAEGVVSPATRSEGYLVLSEGIFASEGKTGGVTADGKYAFLCGNRFDTEEIIFIAFAKK